MSPIIGYWGAPPPDPARYRQAASCGFTHCSAYTDNAQNGLQLLDLAHRAGMKMVLYDLRIQRNLPQQEGWENTVQAVINDYKDHPALFAYFIDDEPHAADFSNDAALAQAFRERDPAHPAFFNLFPMYASEEQLGTPTYRDYVQQFMTQVQPPFLSFDNYSLMQDGTTRSSYFPNLLIIREQALAAGVPFYFIFQTTPQFDLRDPTPIELRWQVYTALAHGCLGFIYYTYWTSELDNSRDGIIDMFGEPTLKYDAARNINLGVQHLLPYLQKLNSVSIYQWPDADPGVPVLDGSGVVKSVSGGEFVIGGFKDTEDLDWIMIVNRTLDYSANVVMNLRTNNNLLSWVSRENGQLMVMETTPTSDGLDANFWLAPGDGMLFKLSDAPQQPQQEKNSTPLVSSSLRACIK